MAIGYTWNVSTVDTYPTLDGNADVVYNVHWRLTATDDEYTASAYGTQSIDTSSLSNFKPFDKLTSDIVKGWVINAMGKEAITNLETGLDAQIESEKNPTSVTKTLDS